MTKDDLVALGLTEEQAKKVAAQLEQFYVAKERLQEVEAELTAAKATIKERDGQLETLKKASGDAGELKAQIATLQQENQAKDEAHATELKALKISNAVELALTGAKARNNVAAKALLGDFLAKAELDADGTVKGLAEAVKKLAEDKETAFLFESPGGKFKGAKAAEKGDGGEGGMTLERLKALSPTERHAYSIEHPEEYKTLYGGGNA